MLAHREAAGEEIGKFYGTYRYSGFLSQKHTMCVAHTGAASSSVSSEMTLVKALIQE